MKLELEADHDARYTLSFTDKGVSNGCVVLKCVYWSGGDPFEHEIRLPPGLLLEMFESLLPWLRTRCRK